MSKTRDIREAVEAELRFDPLADSPAEHDAVAGAGWMANGGYAVIDELYVLG